MLEIQQELMTPQEAARWFRRSPSWLRQQNELLRLGAHGGQPLYHTHVCRAFVLARVLELEGPLLRQVQARALASACGLLADPLLGDLLATSAEPCWGASEEPNDGQPG